MAPAATPKENYRETERGDRQASESAGNRETHERARPRYHREHAGGVRRSSEAQKRTNGQEGGESGWRARIEVAWIHMPKIPDHSRDRAIPSRRLHLSPVPRVHGGGSAHPIVPGSKRASARFGPLTGIGPARIEKRTCSSSGRTNSCAAPLISRRDRGPESRAGHIDLSAHNVDQAGARQRHRRLAPGRVVLRARAPRAGYRVGCTDRRDE